MNPAPLSSPDLEEIVLGSVLLLDRQALERLTVDIGLKPEHFSVPRLRRVYAAMVALYDTDDVIDVATVCDQLALAGHLDDVGGRAAVDALTGKPLEIGREALSLEAGVVSHGRRIRRDAEWRERERTLQRALKAVSARDEDAYLEAEAALTATEDAAGSSTWDPDRIREEVWNYLRGNGDEAIPTSSDALNDLLFGGWRRGDVTFVSGWTSMGKSSWVDGELEHVRGLGFNVHLFMNEMAPIARSLRLASSRSGVPFGRILRRGFYAGDEEKVVDGLKGDLFGLTNCAGWSAERICRLIRAKRWDFVAIDSVNLIPHEGREEIDRISSLLCAVAQQANAHLLVVGLLNKRRADEILPPPVESDIRETGKIAYDAANLLFVHRDQEVVTATGANGEEVPTGEVRKLSNGFLTLAKARNGEPGTAFVRLNRARMRFEDL